MVNPVLFSQIVSKFDRYRFTQLVKQNQSDKFNKGMDPWTHFVSMIFFQFFKSNSRREISNGIRLAIRNLNDSGIIKILSKSSISCQNKHWDWKLFRAYYKILEKLSAEVGFKQVQFNIKSKIYLLDSTTLSLCLSLFDWAKYRTSKGAIKLHTLLDYDGNLPGTIHISDGKVGDNKGGADISLTKNSAIAADRYYFDSSLLNKWDSKDV